MTKISDIYFRVDGGRSIGDGHLFRCFSLAHALLKSGFKIHFIVRPREGLNLDLFKAFKLHLLPSLKYEPNYQLGHDHWLGVEEEIDFKESFKFVSSSKAMWIIDHYGISAKYESLLKKQYQLVFVIDDLHRAHDAHIILDHNLTATEQLYKKNSLSPADYYLMGLQYALLREEIISAKDYVFSQQQSLLLYLGSASENIFDKVITALRKLNLPRLEILKPPSSFKVQSNEMVLNFSSDLAQVYSSQKWVIGSCAVAHLERMAMGVPTISCVVVENQQQVGEKIVEQDIMFHLGDIRTMTSDELFSKIESYMQLEASLVQQKVQKAQKLVAKTGVAKLVRIIEGY
jgi:UDP-2,4-diacetamido-2,4,6-trideoxy-beta-L-altropyranose hydrolase